MKKDVNINRSVETDYLKIRGNSLEIQDTTIQLSNISLFSTTDIEPKKFPILSAVLIIIGVLLFTKALFAAAILIVVGAIWIGLWYFSVQETKEMTRLTIITNSGNVFPIIFNDRAFMKKVVETMSEIIGDPIHKRDVTINIKECTFDNGSSAVDNLYEK